MWLDHLDPPSPSQTDAFLSLKRGLESALAQRVCITEYRGGENCDGLRQTPAHNTRDPANLRGSSRNLKKRLDFCLSNEATNMQETYRKVCICLTPQWHEGSWNQHVERKRRPTSRSSVLAVLMKDYCSAPASTRAPLFPLGESKRNDGAGGLAHWLTGPQVANQSKEINTLNQSA